MGIDSSIFISLVFYLVYGAAVLLPLVVRRISLRTVDPLDPYLVLSLLLFVYTMSTLVSFESTGLAETLDSVSPFSVTKYALACLIGQIGLAVGDLIAPVAAWTGIPAREKASSQLRLNLLIGPGLAVAVLLLPFYVDRINLLNLASYADWAFESRLERSLDQTAGLKDVFLREMPSSLLLCACTALALDRARWFPIRFIASAIIGVYALASLLGGARGVLVATALLPFMYFHYRIRKISPALIVTLGLFGYLLMNALSIARVSSNPEEMIAALADQIGSEGYGFLEVGGSGELKTSTNLVRLIVGIDTGEDAYRWGEVLWSNIASTVPRTLWPDRPPTGSELFAQVFYPGTLESGGGYGSFIFQDPYWDFSFFGVFIFAFGLAYALRKLYIGLVVNDGSSLWILVYTVIYGHLVIAIIRGGMFAGLKGALVSVAPLLVIAAVARLAAIESSLEHPNSG